MNMIKSYLSLIEKNESILVVITILSSKEYILKFCVNIRSEI